MKVVRGMRAILLWGRALVFVFIWLVAAMAFAIKTSDSTLTILGHDVTGLYVICALLVAVFGVYFFLAQLTTWVIQMARWIARRRI